MMDISKEAKRYIQGRNCMIERADGLYIRASDYDAQAARIAELEEEIEGLHEAAAGADL